MLRVVLSLMLVFCACPWAQEVPADSTSPDTAVAPDAPGQTPEPAGEANGVTLLTLETAQQIAIEDNPSLQAAEARVQQAEARVRQARSAWYPQLDLLAAASNTWLSERDYLDAKQSATSPLWSQWALGAQSRLQGQIVSNVSQILDAIASVVNGGTVQTAQPSYTNLEIFNDFAETNLRTIQARGAIDDSFESYSVRLVASWTVFDGFERKFSIAQARFGAEELQAAYEEAQRLLLSAVAQTYHSAQLARENIRIAEADQRFNERQLKEAQVRRRVGTGSLSDELNFEVRVNAARANLIQAYQDYHVALIAMSELLAYPDAHFPDNLELAPLEPESLEDLNGPEPGELIARAKATRPDLAGGEFAVKRADAAVGVSKAPFYPSVVAQASKDGSRSENYQFGEKDFSTSIGVNVQYNLFAGGRDAARVNEAKAARTEAERALAGIELAVASEVRQAVEQLKASQEQLVLQRANAVFVQRNRDLVEKEYAGGVGSLVRLNEAQRDLVSAEGNLAAARVQLRQAWHNVRTATGETILAFILKTAVERD